MSQSLNIYTNGNLETRSKLKGGSHAIEVGTDVVTAGVVEAQGPSMVGAPLRSYGHTLHQLYLPSVGKANRENFTIGGVAVTATRETHAIWTELKA